MLFVQKKKTYLDEKKGVRRAGCAPFPPCILLWRLQNKMLRHWSSWCRPLIFIDELGPFHEQFYQTSALRGPIIQHKQGIQLCYGSL